MDTFDDIRKWAEAHATGEMFSPVARRVLDLLDELDSARVSLEEEKAGHNETIELWNSQKRIARSLAERVTAQSELLTKRANKVDKPENPGYTLRDCPRCGQESVSWDARCGHWLCRSIGCYYSEWGGPYI